MTVQQMKDAILSVYDTPTWRKRVSEMYDDQVIAIYYNFSERGILNKVLKKQRPKIVEVEPVKTEPRYQQLTIFDFIKEER